MKRSLIIIMGLLLLIQVAFAKQEISVKGKVINVEKQPVANASVFLLTSGAKAVLKTAVTNTVGEYTFSNVPQGSFLIEVSAVGFAKTTSSIIEVKEESIQVADIEVKTKDNQIEEVTVTGELPKIQVSHGKLVMNVENSSVSAGNNAFEVLQRAPGVTVDKDGNISLMGQQGVNVTIDGRQTYMTGEQLATFLKSTDGSQIKTIELGTTRSAKDDAEGAAGVINITMKKNKLEGFNGSFVASAAQGQKFRANSSINLSYKKNKSTFFSNYSYTNNKSLENLEIERTIPNGTSETLFDQRAEMINHNRTHNYKIGLEQKTSERNTFVVQFNGSNNLENQDNPSTTNMGSGQGIIDSIMSSMSNSIEKFNRYSFNANNEFKIDSTGKKLTADIDYSFFNTPNDIYYDYHTYSPDMTLLYPAEYERSLSEVDIKILATKLDYTQKLWNGIIETGVKYSNVKSDNVIDFANKEGSSWVENIGRSDAFNYTEQIAAGYFDYSTKVKKWGLKAGVRAEYTMSEGISKTQNKTVKRDYLNLFPSAALSYDINDNHILSLSYARKVSRPNYRNLNPFEYYIDKRTFMRGNPYLNPQYTDGFSLNYTLFKMFNVAVGHDITKDAMVESMGQDTVLKTTWVTKENLGKQSTSYINLTIPARIGKVWSMFNNITGVYMHFRGPIAGYYVSQGSAFIQGNSTHTFKLTKSLSSEVAVRYNSPFLYNVYKIEHKLNTDLGFTYNFKDQRSSLKLAATDIFHTNHNNLSTDFEEYNSRIRQYNDSQTIRLTFNYKFGNLKQAIKRRDNNSEEKDRAQ